MSEKGPPVVREHVVREANIVLVGFMGSGKSEVGKHIADKTGRALLDIDSVVEADGLSINEIFAAEGEPGFRRRERKAVDKVSRARNAVIATGGGVVLDPANVKALKRSGVLVYLEASADELTRRLEGSGDRPLLRPGDGAAAAPVVRKKVSALLAQRTPVYESVADHVVRCEDRQPNDVADEILRRLSATEAGDAPARTRRVRVALDPPYDVHVGRGLLRRVHDLVKSPRAAEKAVIVSHARIRRLWGKPFEDALRSAGLDVAWCTFPEGEESKTPDTAARLARSLARHGLHRHDAVFALGGGVVCDVGGFVASTFARGVAVVQVPTTLLAMVDAAIGGKTGVNLPQGKNLVGTFHQPLGVICDLDVLATLPERELRGGLAEVIKYSFIAEPSLGELVARKRQEIFARGEVLETIVVRSARIKADVVAADEREHGRRAILNYGHTLGHAIEALSVAGRIKKLHHGEAISIGMVYAASVARITGRQDLVDEHRRVLNAAGLPTTVEGVSWSEVRERMNVDKKYAHGLRLVLLDDVGKPVVERVAQKVLQQAFADVVA